MGLAAHSNTFVNLNDNLKWKYWPLILKIHNLAQDDKIIAYSNLETNQVISKARIDSAGLYKEVVAIEDFRYKGNYKDSVITYRKQPKELYDGIVFNIKWENNDPEKLNGQVVGFGLSYALNVNGQFLGSYPSFFLKMDILKHFSENEIAQLKELLAINCTSFTSSTQLYSKENRFRNHSDSTIDFNIYKEPNFYNSHKLYTDLKLENPITSIKEFKELTITKDTSLASYRQQYIWTYDRWFIADHLEYYTLVVFDKAKWELKLSCKSICVSHKVNEQTSKSICMDYETFYGSLNAMQRDRFKADYITGVLEGFEYKQEY